MVLVHFDNLFLFLVYCKIDEQFVSCLDHTQNRITITSEPLTYQLFVQLSIDSVIRTSNKETKIYIIHFNGSKRLLKVFNKY